jgi:hypothetical protein
VQTSAVIASERAKEMVTDMAKAFLRAECRGYAANGECASPVPREDCAPLAASYYEARNRFRLLFA